MNRKLPSNAFAYYLELGVGRSYDAVAKHFGVCERTVYNRAVKEGWQERLAQAERERRVKAEEKALESLEAMDERQLKVLRYIQGKAIKALQDMPIDTAMDAVKAYTMAVEKERLIRGEPGDHTQLTIAEVARGEMRRFLGPEPEEGAAPEPSGS